jgi:hypothetical protein
MISSYIIYHIAFFFCVFFAFLAEKVKDVRFLGVFFSLLFIVALNGFRYNVGTDYESYKTIFEIIAIDGFVITEPGYYLINKLFQNFKDGYIYVFFIFSLLTYLILFYTLLREKILFWGLFFSFAFGFVFLSNNIIRQALVIPIFFYAIRFIYEKKITYYLLSVLICSLFHYSALLLIPFFWIYKINFKQKVWFLIISVCFLLSYTQDFKFLITKIISFAPKYAGYLVYGGEDIKAVKSGATMIIIYFFNLFILSTQNKNLPNEKTKIYYNLYLLGVSISFLTMNISFLFRFSYYLTSLIVIVIPFMIKSTKNLQTKYLYSILFVMISLLFWYKALWFNDHGCMPYISLFK